MLSGLLTSVKAQIDSKKQIIREKNDFQKLTNRTIFDVRLSNGIVNLRKDYEMLSENEFKNDYSMGYLDQIGFRAGTATPYYFYDFSRESQLSLKLTPIFATEESLKRINNTFPFEKLRAAYETLPLKSSILTIVLTNGFLDPNLKNNNLQKYFSIEGLDYLKNIKKNGEKVVFISGHFNNFELMAMQIE